MGILLGGAPGFFTPRMPPPFLHPPASAAAVSFYDVAEGEHYWDGGLVSNTPLQWVLDSSPRQNLARSSLTERRWPTERLRQTAAVSATEPPVSYRVRIVLEKSDAHE